MLGVGFALLFAVLMALASIFSRRGLERGSFVTLLVYSLAIGTPLFLVGGFLTGAFADLPPVGVAYAALGGVIGSVLGRSLYFLGINHLGPGKSLSISATSPLYAAVLAAVVLDESLTPLLVVGTLAIVLGIVGLSRDARAETERAGTSLWVVLYPAAGAVALAITITLRKLALTTGLDPLATGSVNMVVALAAVTVGFVPRHLDIIRGEDPETKRHFAVASVVMAVAFGCYFFGLEITNASVFYPLIQTQPFFATIFSALFLRELEVTSRWTFLGSTTIVLGASLVVLG